MSWKQDHRVTLNILTYSDPSSFVDLDPVMTFHIVFISSHVAPKRPAPGNIRRSICGTNTSADSGRVGHTSKILTMKVGRA